MRNSKYFIYIIMGVAFSACQLFEASEVTNPNAPDAALIAQDASKAQLQSLINGLDSRHRGYVATTSRAFGSFGRETLSYRDSDPRFTTDWLGRAGVPDAGFFAVVDTYEAPYQAIRQGNTIISSAANTEQITETERNGINGFCKTIMGYQYMIPLLAQNENGIRIDVLDPLEPGPFLSFDEAATQIIALLDEGANDLGNAGDEFFFSLSSGWAGFDDPASLLQVNRGIAARVALYREDWGGVMSRLNDSFLDTNGDLDTGPAHTYEGGDGRTVNEEPVGNPFNPFFFVLDAFSTQMEVVHPVVLRDTITGDARNIKFFERTNLVTNQALVEYSATHQDGRWATNTSNVPFMRNEELILMRAEARAQSNMIPEAIADINIIRNDAGIGNYTGGNTLQEVIDEILFQRRYSLWFEPIPHRWVDLRRYDRLSDLEGDFETTSGAFIVTSGAAPESVFVELARPAGETSFDDFFGN